MGVASDLQSTIRCEAQTLFQRRFSHRARTSLENAAYAGSHRGVSDEVICSFFERVVASSNLAGRTIQRLNCLRNRGNSIVAAPDVFRQRAITSTESGPSAIAPHGYREQGEQFRARAVRIPPAAPEKPVIKALLTVNTKPVATRSGLLMTVTFVNCLLRCEQWPPVPPNFFWRKTLASSGSG
jgi:hypothetical protein